MTKDGRIWMLSGNQLKILALIAMTLDHIGKLLLPDCIILQIIGRLSFPIFAYMIAEGCKYTRNRWKYLRNMLVVGLICQIGYFVAMKSLYMGVFITFSLAIMIIYISDYALKDIKKYFIEKEHVITGSTVIIILIKVILLMTFMLSVIYASEVLPKRLTRYFFCIDYGIWGVLMPVLIYYGRGKIGKLFMTLFSMLMLSLYLQEIQVIQWYSFLSIIPLALYNGYRGKIKLKNIFYIYYPLHLVAIYGIYMLIR